MGPAYRAVSCTLHSQAMAGTQISASHHLLYLPPALLRRVGPSQSAGEASYLLQSHQEDPSPRALEVEQADHCPRVLRAPPTYVVYPIT